MSIVLAHGIEANEASVIDERLLVDTKDKVDLDDALNSTNAPLVANAQFTGQWVDVSAFNSLFISWLSNQNSASNGMRMQYSADANTVDWSWEVTTIANQVRTFNLPIYYKYFRIIYVNTTNAQATFRLNVRKSYKMADVTTQTSEFTVNATGAVGVLTNALIPAQGQGTVIYITSVLIEKFATALLTAGATPFVATSTNLNGFSPNIANDAQAAGSLQIVYDQSFNFPLRASAPNTTTAIGTPAIPGAICKVIVTYYVGA